MSFKLYKEVALARDVPEEGLRSGDVATVVDRLPAVDGEEGYILEVFNAVGETLKVAVVPASALRTLTRRDMWSVRPLSKSKAR
jgi:hypothetical protein